MSMPITWALAAALLFWASAGRAATCQPAEVNGGKGSVLTIGSKYGGVYVFMFCRDDYSVQSRYLFAPWSALTPEVFNEIQAARASPEAFEAQVAKVTGRQCEITREDLTVDVAAYDTHWLLCSALRDAMVAVWPPDPVWRGYPNTTKDRSRPMYPVVAGKRSTTAVASPRAAADALCACTQATALPGDVLARRFCPVPPAAGNLVALCSRR